MILKDFKQLRQLVESVDKRTVAVVAAHDAHTLEAVLKTKDEGILDHILIGKKDEIIKIGNELGYDVSPDVIIDSDTDEDAVAKGLDLIKTGGADFLQKGILQTSTLLKGVVNKENGIKARDTLSNVALLDIPAYHKVVGLTDGGMVMYPTLEQKKDIIDNAVEVYKALGYDNPKVAVLCAVETLNPKMPETVDAAELKKMNQEGIIIMPDISAGNLTSKALTVLGGAMMAGIVMGAKCPIALNSRSAAFEEKYYSLLACAYMMSAK